MSVCGDGSVNEVLPEGGDDSQALRANIEAALLKLHLPKLPAPYVEQLGDSCLPILHVFRWTQSSVN